MAELVDSVARRYAVLRPHLNEFQRRLWLGAEAAELGPGGVVVVAKATGVAADTVRRGRKEAGEGGAPGVGRSRLAGGGRKRAESHDGELAAAFDALIDPVTRGDPMSPLRWTSKSIRALTRGLRDLGTPQHPGGPDSRGLPPREPGARLLHDRRWMTVRLITAAEAVVEPNILRVGGGDVGPRKLGCAGSPTLPVQMPFDRPRPGADTSHPTRPSSSGLTTTMQCRSFGFKVRNRRAAQLDEAANITVTRSSG